MKKRSAFSRVAIETAIRGIASDTADHGICACQACKRLMLWREELAIYQRSDELRRDDSFVRDAVVRRAGAKV